jgi:hypothetical protein
MQLRHSFLHRWCHRARFARCDVKIHSLSHDFLRGKVSLVCKRRFSRCVCFNVYEFTTRSGHEFNVKVIIVRRQCETTAG